MLFTAGKHAERSRYVQQNIFIYNPFRRFRDSSKELDSEYFFLCLFLSVCFHILLDTKGRSILFNHFIDMRTTVDLSIFQQKHVFST